MDARFVKNDRILVQKITYWGGGDPHRGDVVVFADPGGWLDAARPGRRATRSPAALELVGLYPTGGHLVKRVIGVGGDQVVCCDSQGRITVNGAAARRASYLPPGVKPSTDRLRRQGAQGLRCG